METLLWLSCLVVPLLATQSRSYYTQRVQARPSFAPNDDWPCPKQRDIAPCFCISDDYNLDMECSDVLNETDLVHAFQAIFPFNKFRELKIIQMGSEDTKLTIIPPGTFGDISFEKIIIRYTNLTEIDEEVFTSSHHTLRSLSLADNQLVIFPFETIESYTHLENLNLDNNMIQELAPIISNSLEFFSISHNENLTFKQDVFTEAPFLEEISMNDINLVELIPNLFDTQENIRIIHLEHNRLTNLDENSFNPISKSIDEIFLNYNNINFVRHDAIDGLNDSFVIHFAANEMVELLKDVWQPVFNEAQGGEFDFSENPLRCGCDIAWIMLDEQDMYLPLITEDTTCNDGTPIHALDIKYFVKECTTFEDPFPFSQGIWL